ITVSSAQVTSWLSTLREGASLDQEGKWGFLGSVAATRCGWLVRARSEGGDTVALRLLRPELVAEEADRELFLAWAEACQAAEHSRLARILQRGFFLNPDGWQLAYLSSPWVAGSTLPQLLQGRGQGLPPEQAFHWLGQVAAALAAVHSAGVIHGELRSSSVLVDRRQQAHLVGLGVPPRLRRRAELLGFGSWATAPWAPPERLKDDGETADPAADVFQLALLTYEAFAGVPYPRWSAPDLLSDLVEFMPFSMDQLLQACLGDAERRPATALEFLARLRDVEASYEQNLRERKGKVRLPSKQLKEWAEELLAQTHPPYELVLALAHKGKAHRGPLALAGPEREFGELAHQARVGLRRRLGEVFSRLLEDRDYASAQGFLDRVGEEVPAEELVELYVRLEKEKASVFPAKTAEAVKVLLGLLKKPELSFAARLSVVEALEHLTAGVSGSRMVGFVKPQGKLRVVETFLVQGQPTVVVLGPALRLGRGNFAQFGNHLDLAPPLDRVVEDSALLLLAQSISRAGHVEFRIGAAGLEAFCLGTHGITLDGVPLGRGEMAALRREGTLVVARGAARGTYRLVSTPQGEPLALEVSFAEGVAAGKRALWVLQRLPLGLLHPPAGECGVVDPTPEGWVVEASTPGLRLGGFPLEVGVRRLWQGEETLVLPEEVEVVREGV
ncbi:MAG: protein kinase, partial [Thermoanaerobaculum sp.]|nr:protein kinase [Thermoanaerobaculum sp.]